MINRYASLKHGLVGCWIPSLGASGFRLIDRSGNGNHGTLTNMDPGTDWVPSGGKLALDFDGVNDYVSVAGNVPATQGLTISVWARWNSTGSASAYPYIVNKAAAASWTSPYWDYSLRIHGSTKVLSAGINNGGLFANVIDGTTTLTVDSIWHHCIFTYNLSTMQLFLDGKLDATKALSLSSINKSSFPLLIGTNNDVSERFNGQIDDVRIWNRTLTPSEIRLLYTGGRGVGLLPERSKHRRKTSAAASNRRRRIICGANC